MSVLELLRAEDPAIAAEARYLELRRKYSQVRRMGLPRNGGLEAAPNPAYAVLAPFVTSAMAARRRGSSGLSASATRR
ncbi:MAG: hypothetical protein WD557_19795 [Dehalococcoidia bacterium]